MHCKITFARTDVAFHILVTLGRGGKRKVEGGERIEKEKEERDAGVKIQNLLDFCLTFHLSLSHKWCLENKGMAWGRDVVVI